MDSLYMAYLWLIYGLSDNIMTIGSAFVIKKVRLVMRRTSDSLYK